MFGNLLKPDTLATVSDGGDSLFTVGEVVTIIYTLFDDSVITQNNWAFVGTNGNTTSASLLFQRVSEPASFITLSNAGAKPPPFTPDPVNTPVCFLKGTRIAAEHGDRAIEELAVGDLVRTTEGLKPVRFITINQNDPLVTGLAQALPIRIKATALGSGLPVRDLLVSPDHAILIEGHLVHASVLVNGHTIVQTKLEEWANQPSLTYYNIELETHSIIQAEGASVESFVDNVPRKTLDNYSEYIKLYGKDIPIQELTLPRIKFRRQLSARLKSILEPALALA